MYFSHSRRSFFLASQSRRPITFTSRRAGGLNTCWLAFARPANFNARHQPSDRKTIRGRHGASVPLPILRAVAYLAGGNISSGRCGVRNRRSVWALHECPNGLIHNSGWERIG